MALILPQMVEVTWTSHKKWYVERGYTFTKLGDNFLVNVQDIRKSERIKINVLCDYCLDEGKETIVEKYYYDYLSQRKVIEKDCCKFCYPQKVVDVTLVRHGVTSTNKLDSVKQKKVEVNRKNYGVDSYTQTEEFKEKLIKYSLDKYGTKYPVMAKEVREK